MVQTYRHVVEAVLEKIAFCTVLGSDLVADHHSTFSTRVDARKAFLAPRRARARQRALIAVRSARRVFARLPRTRARP